MHKISTVIIAAGVLLPGFIAAEDFESYMNRMIENAKQGGGTVIIENHSSVSTGGQVAGAGEAVVTDGDVSASSHTETRINAGGSGGEVYVKTETSQNGETKTEEYTKSVAPGEPIEVNVSARATNETMESTTEIQGEMMQGATSTTDSDMEKERGVTVTTRFEAAIEAVPGFIKKIFVFLKFW